MALLGLMAAGTVQAATCTSQGSGNWNTAATWKCPTTANFSNVGTFTDGSKVQKTRPCAVVSPTEIHDHLRTVMVAPMTTRAPPAGFPVSQTFQGQSGLVLLGQPRTLDKLRQVKRLGSIEPATLKQLQVTLQAVFQPA